MIRRSTLKEKLYTVIFEAETPAGKAFDVILLVLIVASVVTVSLESVAELRREHLHTFVALEWTFTFIFTVEYLLRIYSTPKPFKYIFSFFGLVDLLSIIPTYLSLFILGTHYLLVVRMLRLLRIARIFKMTHFIYAGQHLMRALKASSTKISVFLGTVVILVVIIGSLMYVIEGEASGFTSIPTSVYWAIVTLTTVGYGDIAPVTALGQVLASLVMIMGYGIIAVPTGIVTVEMSRNDNKIASTRVCANCHEEGHFADASFCYNCGYELADNLK